MSRLTKLLVLVISIISIVQSVWLLALVVPIDYVSKLVLPSVQTNTDWLLIAALTISVIVALIGVAAIITVLFAPKKADQLIFRSPSGQLSISKKAIEKSLAEAVLQHAEVADVQTNVKLHTRNRVARVKVTAVDKEGRDLVKLGEDIQSIVTNKIANLMDVKVKKVKVKVNPFDSIRDKKRANHPRVV